MEQGYTIQSASTESDPWGDGWGAGSYQ